MFHCMRKCFYLDCTCACTNLYELNQLSFKYKDPSIRYRDNCKIILLFLQTPARKAGPASKLVLCRVSSEIISRTLIGGKYECYIVIEVIEVNELEEGNILPSSSTSMTNICVSVDTAIVAMTYFKH